MQNLEMTPYYCKGLHLGSDFLKESSFDKIFQIFLILGKLRYILDVLRQYSGT